MEMIVIATKSIDKQVIIDNERCFIKLVNALEEAKRIAKNRKKLKIKYKSISQKDLDKILNNISRKE